MKLVLVSFLAVSIATPVAAADPAQVPPNIETGADGNVHLVCELDALGVKTTLELYLDLQKRTAAMTDPARKAGPVPAVFERDRVKFADPVRPGLVRHYVLNWEDVRLTRDITLGGQPFKQSGICGFVKAPPRPAAPQVAAHPAPRPAPPMLQERPAIASIPAVDKAAVQRAFARALAANPGDVEMEGHPALLPAIYSATGTGCVTTVQVSTPHVELGNDRFSRATHQTIVIDWSQVRKVGLSRPPRTNLPSLIYVLLDTPAIRQGDNQFPAGTVHAARVLRDQLNLLAAACR